MDDINLLAVLVAAACQFAVGAVWYMAIFSKAWGDMHGFDKLSKAQQKEMASKMGPWYGLQMLVTVVMVFVLAKMILLVPGYSPYALASLLWLGFIVPTEYSAVAFGGTESKWMLKKFLISSFGSLACLLIGAFILGLF
jgi:hypothetical protein